MKRSSPLRWPEGWRRTPLIERRGSIFSNPALMGAEGTLVYELERLGAQGAVLTFNLDLRSDGELRIEQHRALLNGNQPNDRGVAVYFTLKGKEHALACDRFYRVEDNVRALAKHIGTIRAQERYGVGTIEQAFRGYAALPAAAASSGPAAAPWWYSLGVKPEATPEEIEDAYRRGAQLLHPDKGGTAEAMAALNLARAEGRKARGA